MNRTVILLAAIAVVSGIAGFLSARHFQEEQLVPIRQEAESGIGHPIPTLSGESIDGQPLAFSSFSGKAVLVNFWATWCAPCRREMPDLMALRKELDTDTAEILGVAVDRPEDVRAFVAELGIEYPILIPDELEGTRVLRKLGNSNGLLPFSVVIDAGGMVRETHLGELSQEQASVMINTAH